MLVAHRANQEELKTLLGCEYTDYDLVFASPVGRPMEGQVINRALSKLISDYNLPKVVFHSLRHSSITYKLKLNGGDMKSVQGDSGHAQLKMVSDVYSHILDEDMRRHFMVSKTPPLPRGWKKQVAVKNCCKSSPNHQSLRTSFLPNSKQSPCSLLARKKKEKYTC